MTGSWIEQTQAASTKLVLLLMTGLVLWQVVLRSSYEISIALMEEMWSRSFINLFASPLSDVEWVLAAMISGLLKMGAVLAFGGAAVALFYHLNIFSLGLYLFLFGMLLVMAGWIIGFLAGAVIVLVGPRIGALPWILGYFFAPFSGVFYPVEGLPVWAKLISYSIPTTYVFQAMRTFVQTGVLAWNLIGVALVLDVVYLSLALSLFFVMFAKSRRRGLYRLE
jgi:ABC-2 type transport system permease protein